MADPKNTLNTGILATQNPQVLQYLNTVDSLPLRQTDMVDVRRREAELSKYLGAPDYDAQIDKSREDAKLQFFLQMAQRGFAAAGAAPRRGESTVSTLSRELFSPLAGDASKLAGQFTKEKRAIDTAKRAGTRQLRLAALQQSQAGQARLEALATKLMPTVKKPSDTTPFAATNYVVVRKPGVGGKPDTFSFAGGKPVQVRQEKGKPGQLSSPLNVVDGKPFKLLPGYELMTFDNLPNNMKGVVEETTEDKETDAERLSRSRLGLLLNSMSEIQVGKVGGVTSAYNAKAAFYFDPAEHLAGKFAFKYIPPGTDINDRSKDVTITNPSIIKLINNKLRNVSDTILKVNYDDTAADTQRTRLQDSVRRMLSLPASTVFGATPIEVIGTNAENQLIGYTPSADAISPATVIDNAKTAMATLGNASERYTPLLDVLKPLPDVDNEADSRTTWGRLKTAASAFPEAFKYTGEGKPGTDDYDEQKVQQRLDIENNLRNAALNPQASTTDHRAVLQKVAAASREKREKVQNTNSEVGNDLLLERLTLRDALLAFKNAAMESNVSGFVTGTLAGGAAKLGFAKFIAGKGSKHWARLKVASDRMSSGYSRRAGREFGDTRISNYDAKDYKKLLPSIENDEEFNSILIEDALKRNGVELRQLMENGGDFGWTKEQLQNAAKAGVNFATLKTKKNWHGHGFYGKNRYTASRQYTPTLSNEQRSNLRTQGQLNDTMYDGLLTVPSINYSGTKTKYSFSPYTPKKGNIPASGTKTTIMDAPQFEEWLKGRAGHFKVEVEEMRRRVVQGILSYNVWRQ